MKNSFALARKDFSSYFNSWTGVLLSFFFLLVAGLFFVFLVMTFAKMSMNAAHDGFQNVEGLALTRFVFGSFYTNLSVLLIFVVPILSMRALAEERRQETLELLFTYPLSDIEIVWGKLLGMVWFLEFLFVPTLLYAAVLFRLSGELDWGPVLMGFLGFWFLGTGYLTLGLFISSVAESPVVSSVITFGVLILFWILDWAVSATDGTLAHVLASISPLSHYREFTVGVIDIKNIAYFLFFHFFFLFLTLRSVETRHWKN